MKDFSKNNKTSVLPLSGKKDKSARFKGLKILSWGIFFIIVLGVTGNLIRLHFLPISEIEVYGNVLLSRETLIKATGIDEKNSVFSIDTYEASQNLTQYQWIKRGRVRVEPPSHIKIYVEERKPVAFFRTHERIFLIDRDRLLLAPLYNRQAWNLPVITYLAPKVKLKTGDQPVFSGLERALELIDLLSQSHILPLDSVSEIIIDNPINLQLITMPYNIRINLGADDFAKRLNNLSHALPELEPIRSKITLIDLQYTSRVLVKRK